MWLSTAHPDKAATRAPWAFGNGPAAGWAVGCCGGRHCCWPAVVLGRRGRYHLRLDAIVARSCTLGFVGGRGEHNLLLADARVVSPGATHRGLVTHPELRGMRRRGGGVGRIDKTAGGS